MYFMFKLSVIKKDMCFSRNHNLGRIVQLLVHNKADVNDVDPKNRNTALHYVVQARAPSKLKILFSFHFD